MVKINATGKQSYYKPSDGWLTPEDLAHALGWFDLDPCSGPGSHVLARTAYDERRGQDGLTTGWLGSVFVNPPYSRPLPWAAKLALHAHPWCALVKLDPTTVWWRTLMSGAEAWSPFRTRLRFEPGQDTRGKATTANFANALVWGGGWTVPPDARVWIWQPFVRTT